MTNELSSPGAGKRSSWLRLGRAGLAVAALSTLPGGSEDSTYFGVRSAGRILSPEGGAVLNPRSAPAPVPNLVAEVDVDRARTANAALAFSAEPLETARPLRFDMSAGWSIEQDSSLDCLTAAIYYEAASEPLQGQRAVAQVVLNRMRHPSFPNSVCKVVYQGSDRKTGCQFTFTCDGSLNRTPALWLWERARRIAQEALQGRVEPSVGLATHYHTDWVYPYWAPSLKKMAKLGTHIFYGWPGAWGRRAAFNQPPVWTMAGPASEEMLATIPLGEEVAPVGQKPMTLPPSRLIADSAGEAPLPRGALSVDPPGRPLADERRGTLVADQSR